MLITQSFHFLLILDCKRKKIIIKTHRFFASYPKTIQYIFNIFNMKCYKCWTQTENQKAIKINSHSGKSAKAHTHNFQHKFYFTRFYFIFFYYFLFLLEETNKNCENWLKIDKAAFLMIKWKITDVIIENLKLEIGSPINTSSSQQIL